MTTPTKANSAITARTIVAHNEAMGWEIDGKEHALGMILVDLMVFAACYGLDFDTELADSREVVEEVYDGDDLSPIAGAELPPPLPTSLMLEMSTRHISKETAEWLQYHRSGCYQKGDYGWFVWSGDSAREDDPADLRAVLDFARAERVTWVMLDCDTDAVDGLPTFEW